MRTLMIVTLVVQSACSLITVKQDPFPAMEVSAQRPPKKPPRVVLTASSIQIREKVMFATGSAEILPESHGLLQEVAKVLQDNEQIELLQVEGHTDSVGSKAYNKKLSKQRAQSVQKFLASAGVANKRMKAIGYGPERPIADNESEQGRDSNRRVEFNIVKQGKKKVVVEDED